MLNSKRQINKEINFPPKYIINDKIYLFLYSLIREIFLGKKTSSKRLNNYINKINRAIIKFHSNYLNIEYNTKNLINIFLFIQTQNNVFASDILESILIIIFSSIYKSNNGKNFENLIYVDEKGNNKLFKSGNYQIIDLFDYKKLIPEELQNLKNLLETEDKFEKDNIINNSLKQSPIYNLLLEIQKYKYKFLFSKNKDLIKELENFENIKDYNELFTKQYFNKKLIRLFLISVYFYSYNKNSPLMNYTIEKIIKDKTDNIEYLSSIPYNYNLDSAKLTTIFTNYIISPIKIEPKISELTISHNNIGFNGLFDIGKSLIFNKNIEKCYLNNSNIKFFYLEYINYGLGIFDNYNLKELDLSYNKINKDSEIYLSKLISHMKGLKKINLSMNNIKRGVASFFIMLKELYSKNKINLETLMLNECNLDISSFYELGELLKSPFCKLKKLYLNMNIIPDCINFFKKLKQNKSLEELYLNKTNINDNDINDIIKIILNTHIQALYLYNNLISNLDDLIRIISTTKVVKYRESDDEYINNEYNSIIINEQTFLENLDLSNNFILNKNEHNVKLLQEIKNESNLSCLDLSLTLNKGFPKKIEISESSNNYRKILNDLIIETNKEKEEYNNNKIKEKYANIDLNREKEEIKSMKNDLLNIYNIEILNILDDEINELILEKEYNQLELKKKIRQIIFDLAEKNSKIKDLLIIKEDINNKIKRRINGDNYKNIEKYFFHNILLKESTNQLKILEENKKDRKLFII